MRSSSRVLIAVLVSGAVVTGAAVAHAQGVPGVSPNKCLAGKTKCVVKKAQGLLKCRQKCQASPASCGEKQATCEARVREKYVGADPADGCFEKLEARSGTGNPAKDCTTFDDRGDIEHRVDRFVSATVATLEGNPTDVCSRTLATGQTSCWNTAGTLIPCAGTGHDGDVQAGVPLAYFDNGDGTITDLNLGLVWEKKSSDGSIHDVDSSYTWEDAFGVHLAALNAGTGFAGHTDWRLPNVRELKAIVDYDFVTFSPAVSPAFDDACAPTCSVSTCSCTTPGSYWTSTTYAPSPSQAWTVEFGTGFRDPNDKDITNPVRAVRGP